MSNEPRLSRILIFLPKFSLFMYHILMNYIKHKHAITIKLLLPTSHHRRPSERTKNSSELASAVVKIAEEGGGRWNREEKGEGGRTHGGFNLCRRRRLFRRRSKKPAGKLGKRSEDSKTKRH